MNDHEKRGCGISCIEICIFVAMFGVLVYMLLPSVGSPHRGIRTQCTNNLRQILLALHEYHSANGTFPPAFTVDANGKPLHSWRTLILPYLGEQQLYERINFAEPWNSPHNQTIAKEDLPIFTCAKSKRGLAYLGAATPGAIFEGTDAHAFPEVSDGASLTIAVIEVVPLSTSWMRPIDFSQNDFDKAVTDGLASEHPGGTQIAFIDGSVRFVEQDIGAVTLQALLTLNGKEPVDLP